MRSTKTWTISLPPTLEKDALKVARAESRTKSELVREALRDYLARREWETVQAKASIKAVQAGVLTEEDLESIITDYRKKR